MGPALLDEQQLREDLKSQIIEKLKSYAAYDKKRGFYDEESFVDLKWVLQKLNVSQWICPDQGCEMQREGNRQWTLDRIDNDIGHAKHNCRIVCLSCNTAKH